MPGSFPAPLQQTGTGPSPVQASAGGVSGDGDTCSHGGAARMLVGAPWTSVSPSVPQFPSLRMVTRLRGGHALEQRGWKRSPGLTLVLARAWRLALLAVL